MGVWVSVTGTLLGVIVTALVAWIIARRNSSGRIETSDAKTLWAAAEKLREEQSEEKAALRAEAAAMREEAVGLRNEAIALRLEVAALRLEIPQVRAELTKALAAAKACRAEVVKLRKRLTAVEHEQA